jgi:DNA polymerase III epsilon subunit-like protein
MMNYIFYDLETNGLDYYTTGIMQLTMLDVNGNIILNQYTYPFDNRIDGTSIHGIDEQKLIDNNAITTVNACTLMKHKIHEKYGNDDIHLIAYNNFGYDQIILENNFKICSIKIPDNWYFIDLFPIVKAMYPTIKPNYKLRTVFEAICGKDTSINFHCALGDTTCLYKIFQKIDHSTRSILFPKYTRGLMHSNNIFMSPISSLNGVHASMLLEEKGVSIIGDLYEIFKNVDYDNDNFEYYLKTYLGVYSKYYIGNMIKQLNIIKYLR